MSKKEEREKLSKIACSENFEEECEKAGFTVCHTSEEGTGKKKANI